MRNIIVSEKHTSAVDGIKKMIELYYVLNNLKYSKREVEFVAYYVLYGISNETDDIIMDECLAHLEKRMAKQVVCNVKSHLKKYRLVTPGPKKTLQLIPALQTKLAPDSPVNYVVQFTVDAA